MGRFLADDAPQRAVDRYLDTLTNVERQRLQPKFLEQLVEKTGQIADDLENLLTQVQALSGNGEEERILLYELLKQLPVVTFEPINYAFVGRVVIPLENVIDLLVNLDTYNSGQPVRRGTSPGTVELISVSEQDVDSPPAPQGVIGIAGIGRTYSAILRERADIRNTQDLLDKGWTVQDRIALAEQTGLSEKILARWVRRADLMRIEGIGEEYGELLEMTGIKSVAELARRNPSNLYEKMRLTNAARDLVDRLPSSEQVTAWVDRAKELAS